MALLRFWLACIVTLVFAAGSTGCRSKEETPTPVPSNVAPPDSLLCEGTVRAPDSTWKNVQQGVG